MMSTNIKIYVHFIDGVQVYIPTPALIISGGKYKLLPNQEFDYDDDSILFEFGVNDVVDCKLKKFENNDEPCLVAVKLIKSGSDKNDYKRMLLCILLENPEPRIIIERFDKSIIEKLLSQINYVYPGLINWIDKNRLIINQQLSERAS